MFDLKLTASDFGSNESHDANGFQSIAVQVRTWLSSTPEPSALVSNPAALELALAAYLKNRDVELLTLVQAAFARAGVAEPARMTLSELAGLVRLNLFLAQLTALPEYQDNARRWLHAAAALFDEELGYFKRTPAAESHVLFTDENVKLAEVFYCGWRVLDEPQLRPFAGIVLEQVSDLFDANAGLYQRAELSGGARSETGNLNAYASAIQMFLTAGETTARGTYISRARILADYLIQHTLAIENAGLARALLRLEQFTSEPMYRRAAQDMLKQIREKVELGVSAAEYGLAVQELEQFPLHIAILGDVENDPNASEMWDAALKQYAPARAIEVLNPSRQTARIQQLGYLASDMSALGYVCVGPVCLPPVRSAAALRETIARVRAN